MSVTEDPFVESQTKQLLLEAGLESAPFDPASFEALKNHIRDSAKARNPLFDDVAVPTTLEKGDKPRLNEDANNEEKEVEERVEEPPLPNIDVYGPTASGKNSNNNDVATPTKIVVPTAQRHAVFSPTASDVTDPGSSIRVQYRHHQNTSNISAISGTSLTTEIEARILEQLQVQTTLILQLQRRVDELTDMVHRQQEQIRYSTAQSSFQQQQGSGKNHLPPIQRFMSELTQSSDAQTPPVDPSRQPTLFVDHTPNEAQVAAAHRTHPSDAPTDAAVAPAQQGAPRPAGVQPQPAAAAPRGIWRVLLNPTEYLRHSRVAKLYQVFSAMRKQEVQDIQWGLIIKVVVMITILFGRAMSRPGRNKKQSIDSEGTASFYSEIPFKFYILVAVALLGIMGQTGYLKFFYKFCVKDRLPHRILLDGEDVEAILRDLEERARPDPQRQARDAAAAANGEPRPGDGGGAINWGDTFLLGGRIARRGGNNNDNGQNVAQPIGVGGALWSSLLDIFYLFGSFFLSIFPTWRPQPVPQAVARGQAVPEGQGPGQVRPPGDPAANDDDGSSAADEGDGDY